jgi:general secretion pathway protein G
MPTSLKLKGWFKGSLKQAAGFTLVELLVAISILAILSAIGLAAYSKSQELARDAKRRGDVDAIKKALYLLQSSKGSFCDAPNGFTGSWYTVAGVDSDARPKAALETSGYMPKLPADPKWESRYLTLSGQGLSWTYAVNVTDCDHFTVSAHLEQYPAASAAPNLPCTPQPNQSGGGWNYCVRD